jgi:nitrate reductase NapD
MEPEVHIAGVVVYAQPAHLDSITSCISAIPHAEVHGRDAEGKLVVTLETESTRRTVDYMDAIRALPGVIDVVLVYQHAEPLAALEQALEQEASA